MTGPEEHERGWIYPGVIYDSAEVTVDWYRRWELWLARTGRWSTRRWTIIDTMISKFPHDR